MSHNHVHTEAQGGRRIGIAIILTIAFVIGEFVAGRMSHSLALLSDAGHNFADALALILSWYALRMTLKPGDTRKTFGYHRIGILTALVNAASLAVIALAIIWEAVVRLRSPEPVHSGSMIVVALIAIIMNTIISIWLHAGAKNDLNIRSAYLHMLGDALAAVGVVMAGIIIRLTGNPIADALVSLLIGGFILYSSRDIWVEVVTILMEAAPHKLDVSVIECSIRAVSGVFDVHDIHSWTVGSGITACSCHVTVGRENANRCQEILHSIVSMLEQKFGFAHATVQIEVDGFAATVSCGNGDPGNSSCLEPVEV